MIAGITPFESVVYASIVIFALLLSTIILTIGYSSYTYRKESVKFRTREALKEDFLAELRKSPPDWETFTSDLTSFEKEVVRDLLRDFLEIVSGTEQERMRGLGGEMGIDDWTVDLLKHGNKQEKLRALHWMELLGSQSEVSELIENCKGDRQLEAKAVNVLAEGDHPFVLDLGTDLLLSPGEPLSVHGMDALLKLYENRAEDLFCRAKASSDEWDSLLLYQVLSVLYKCTAADIEASTPWLVNLVEHRSELVRSKALEVITKYAWQAEFRELLSIDQVVQDPSDRVRIAAYDLLGTWGDGDAIELLLSAVATEPNERAKFAGTRILYRHRDAIEAPLPGPVEQSWGWVQARESIES